MSNRYYYEAGCGKDSIDGNLLANNHQDAMTLITKALKDIGYEQSDITFVNIDHVDNDDIMALQYKDQREKFNQLTQAMEDVFCDVGITKQDVINITGRLSAKTCHKLVKLLGY